MFIFTTALAFLSTKTFAQQCADAGIGLCVGDVCPIGFTCIDDNLPTETCCADNNIVTITTTTTTTTTTAPPTTLPPSTVPPSTCVDKLNPMTGTSDCPMRIAYCQNSVYYDLMTDQCPLTCGRCPGTTTGSTDCADKINPKTGASDCPGMAAYCTNSVYLALMTDQCPKTCGKCSTSSTGSANTGTTSCVDKINPNTGVSDCPMRTNLCSVSVYYDLMTDQCPQTCGRCSISTGATNTGSTNTGTQTTYCVDKINPNTGVSDCPARQDLCNNQIYYALMTDQCPKTCGRCSG